jgi:hypothetical protein
LCPLPVPTATLLFEATNFQVTQPCIHRPRSRKFTRCGVASCGRARCQAQPVTVQCGCLARLAEPRDVARGEKMNECR